MTKVIPFPIKIEIPQTEEECKAAWFGHGKRGKDGWKILAFFKTMQMKCPGGKITSRMNHIEVMTADGRKLVYPDGCVLTETDMAWVIDPAMYDLGSTYAEVLKAAKLFSDKERRGDDEFIGMSLPFRGRFPMMVPDSMEQLMADESFP